jgi:hypothetical protein
LSSFATLQPFEINLWGAFRSQVFHLIDAHDLSPDTEKSLTIKHPVPTIFPRI